MVPKTNGKKGKERAEKGLDNNGSRSKLKPANSINVRHILCEKWSKKELALDKLRAGASFDEVARDFSEDKARQAGSLGWKTRGSLDNAFEVIAYGLEPSKTGNPIYAEVKTKNGYHILMVEGRR